MLGIKAQGLPITTIIISVMGLIILVVLVAIVTNKIGGFSKSVDSVADIDIDKIIGISSTGEDKTESEDTTNAGGPAFQYIEGIGGPPTLGDSGLE